MLKGQSRKTALLLIPQPEVAPPHGYEDAQEELNLEFRAQITELINACIYLVAEIVRRTEFYCIKFCTCFKL